jgi:3',5'-cyclic AMP phosphodiesterase CpdA
MSTSILHLSDLHVGARKAQQDATFGVALAALIDRVTPALVVVTGDLTHHGTARQHARAADFLKGLGQPLLVVPGNHDLPFWPLARLTRPWREFERAWGTTEPVFSNEGIQAVGLTSARALRHQGGSIGRAQLERAAVRLGEAAPGACRIAAFHHQLTGAPWRSRKRPLARRGTVLTRLREAGAELVLGGHIHQAGASAEREFEVGGGSVLVTTAPGLGRPRPRRRGEACGALAYAVDEGAIRVETHTWQEPEFVFTAARRFPRGAARLAGEPA